MAKRTYKAVDPDLLPPEYLHDEDEVARVMGLQRHFVKTCRERVGKRLEGCYAIEGGAVLYSREGLAELLKELGLVRGDEYLERIAEASRVGPDWRRLREGCRRAAVSMLPSNRQLVLAMLTDDPERTTVRVLVGSSENFVAGMEMCVRCVSEPDLYELVGARPRARGVW